MQAVLSGASLLSSPAQRCVTTARALRPDTDIPTDPRWWEQDFGAHEGLPFADLPDLGPLSLEDLAQHRAPGGESYNDMAARVGPALREAVAHVRDHGPHVIVCHAGPIRVALGHALGLTHAGLAFEIAPFSITRLRCFDGDLSIISTNATYSEVMP
jgi:alpha-ribazole phosphatase